MVYESDFYTTRRPYSRPTVTSYSVTTPRHYVVLDTPDRPRRAEEQYSYSYNQETSDTRYDSGSSVPSRSYSSSSERVSRSSGAGPGSNYNYSTERSSRSSDQPGGYHSSYSSTTSGRLPHGVKLPGVGKGQTYHHNIPSIAHKRLVMLTPSAHGARVKQSVILGEIDRINHKMRPSLAYQPMEDYLNNRSIVSFDDETRSIRAKTAEILKRIHTPVPRAQRPLPLPGDAFYSHSELPISERISSDNYINRLLSTNKQVQQDVLTLSHYDEPTRPYSNIGRGHLACVSFAGGRPIQKRRNLAGATDDVIRDEIKVLSHYGRFRAAVNGQPHSGLPESTSEYVPTPLPHRPPTKSSVTGSWKSNAPNRPDKQDRPDHPAAVAAAEEYEATQDRKVRRREAIEAAARREADEEKRRKQELLRQDELAQQAAIDRQEDLDRKAKEEEALKQREEEEMIAREAAERAAAEQRAKEEAERIAREEEERIAKEEEDRILREEEEKLAKKAAKAKAKEEAAKKAEEAKAKEEAERKAKEEEEQRIKEEEERKAKEEADRKAKDEEERLAKEEAERLAKEEEERKLKEEAERLAKEEEERKANEEAERLAQEEQERLAKEAEESAQEQAADAVEEVVLDDEAGPEPVVEEPQSPDTPADATDPADNPAAEEVVSDTAEEE